MAENKATKTESNDKAISRNRDGMKSLNITIPDELYAKIDAESWVLRERSLSATARAIFEKYFDSKS